MPTRRQILATATGAAAALLTRGSNTLAQETTAPVTQSATPEILGATEPVNHGATDAFGLNLHLDRFAPELVTQQLARAKAMGVRWVRGVSAAWYYVQPKPDVRDYGRPDRALELVEQAGMTAMGNFGNPPAWASRLDPNRVKGPWGMSLYPPDDLSLFEEHVRQTVTRYKGRISVWSPWNEPDSRHFFYKDPAPDFTGDEAAFLLVRRAAFMDIQRSAYRAAKEADPNCTVLSGGFAVGGTRTDKDFISWCIENGLMDHCDAIDLHMYWSCRNLRETVARARKWMREAGNEKPVWMTEFGASLREDKTWIGQFNHEQIQNFVPKALITSVAVGVEKLFWYQGYTDGSGPTPFAKSNYSLNVTDGPTPAAWAFSATTRMLAGARDIKVAELTVSKGRARGYRATVPGGELFIAWAEDASGEENRAASAEVTFESPHGSLPLSLSERPTVLMF